MCVLVTDRTRPVYIPNMQSLAGEKSAGRTKYRTFKSLEFSKIRNLCLPKLMPRICQALGTSFQCRAAVEERREAALKSLLSFYGSFSLKLKGKREWLPEPSIEL